MHMNNVNEAINHKTAAFRLVGKHHYATEETRRHWRKIWKRNGGRKVKTLRTHRIGK